MVVFGFVEILLGIFWNADLVDDEIHTEIWNIIYANRVIIYGKYETALNGYKC